MKLRKIVSISLVVIILSTFLTCAIPVSAATNNTISSDSNLEAIAGNTISVPVTISNNQGLMGYDINFTYDEKVLTPIEVTQGDIFTEGFFEDDIDGKTSTNNSFRVFWANANQYTENGVLFYLKFSVDSQATGETEIIIDYDKSATFNGNYSGVLLNCSNIRISIKNNEYDGKPMFSIVGTDIAAGDILNLDFYVENLGSTKSVVFTVPYDNANFRYSSIILNGVKAEATDNGDSVSINVSDLSKASEGKILTLQMQSENFATAKSYSFFPQYSNLQGVDKVLIKGTEITVTPTTESDSIVIYSNEINTISYGDNQLVIPLYIKHNTGLMGFTFTFNYDPSVLEIDSAKMSNSFKGKFFTDIDSKKSGQFTCLWFANDNIYSNGDFLTLTFNVLAENESTGNITVSYNEKDIISEKTDGVKASVPTINYKVNEVKLSSISVANLPTKTSYFIGENLDTTGLQLKLSYDDGSTSYATSGFTTSGFDSTKAGTQTVTVTYQGKTATFNVTVKEKKLTGISVSKQPTKTSYFIGENLDTTGLQLKLSYDDGSTSYATSGFTTSGFDSSKAGTQTVTVTYQEKTATFNVTVKEKKLTGISVSKQPTKTSYFIGENLDTTGLQLKLSYDDGSTSYATSGFTTSGFDSTKAGTQTVTVTYQGKTATFNVTVKEKKLTGISVSKQPTKTSYFIGENLDTTGLQLKLSYDDGSTSYATSGFTTSGFDSTKAGTQTVTVTYQGKTATFNVTVKEKKLTGISVSKQPTKTSYFIGENLDTTGLQLKLSYDDGSTSYATSGFTTSGFDSTKAGTQTVTVTYQGKTATFNVTVKEKKLTGISVSKQPTKTSYFIGENLDTTGLQLKLSYDDGSTSYATSGFTTSGFDSTKAGTQTVTVTYQGKTTTFNVTVKEKKLTGISVSKQPTKTSYFIGENLDTTGLQLKMSYDDGSTSYATSGFTTSGFDSTKAGTQTVTVTYQGKTATFNVTVKEKKLTGISVSKQPTKTSYFIGENLDTTGLQLKMSYDDGSTSYATSGFTTSGFDSTKAGTQTVTVTYQGKTATFNVTVKEKKLTGISVSKQPTKTSYFIGENLDTTGLQLKMSYDDGSTSYATSGFTTSGFDSTKAGTQTVTVTYQGKTATFNVTVKEKKLTGISVSKQPTKTSYFIGENLDTTGLQLKLSYDDGSTSYATSGFTTSGFDSTKAGTQTVTVTYQGKTATFNVTVKEKKLTGISVSKQPTKTSYFIGENLDTTGLQLKLSYDDGSTSYATSGFTTSGFDSTKAGTQTVTVTYQGKTATFNVTVKEKKLTGISVSKQPTKTSYFIGENLDTTGLQLKLSYDDGSTSYATSGFTTSGFDSTKAGTQTVTVTYQGKTATFNVTVKEKKLTGISVSKQPTKTSYFIGENLDTTGLQLKLSYDDGSTSYATSGFTTSGFDSTKAGTQTVTVTYQEKTATFNVTVKEKKLTGISVSKQPTKTSYFIGENLDTTGLQLKLSFDDGSTSYATSGFTTSGYDSSKASIQTVTVSYLDKTTTFDVTVKEKSLTGISIFRQPTRTNYLVGEALDTSGLELELSYDDGSTSYATSGFTTSGFDSSTVGDKTVSVFYQGKEVSFVVAVSEDIVYLLGDVDGDGKITITDATTIQKYIAEYAMANPEIIQLCGDVDGDGKITITDVTIIQKYIAEYSLPYDIGKPIQPNNGKWTLDTNGTLTVKSDEAMVGYNKDETPWKNKRQYIKHVVIENGVTRIGKFAFNECSNLESVEIPDSVTEIGCSAFCGCSNLSEVFFPESVESIEEEAFSCISNLTIYGFTDSESEKYAIRNSINFVPLLDTGKTGDCLWTLDANGVFNVRGKGSMEDYETTGKVPWKDHRSDIKNIIIGNGVNYIGKYDFSYCSNLSEVSIPESVKTIQDAAFYDCNSLVEVSIPKSVELIGYNVFGSCNGLENISVDSENSNYSSIDGNLYNKSQTVLLLYAIGNRADSFIVPDGVKRIESDAFEKSEYLTSIIIPAGTESIGNWAFENCKSLKDVFIPESVTDLGSNLFYKCSEVIIYGLSGSEAEKYAKSSGNSFVPLLDTGKTGDCLWTLYANGVFSVIGKGSMEDYETTGKVPWKDHRSDIKNIIIVNGVNYIGKYDFSYCPNLSEVSIPESVKTIQDAAFYDCNSLVEVSIPKSVELIGYNAFGSCNGLENISVDSENSNYSSIDGNLYNKSQTVLLLYAIGNRVDSFIIPDGVKRIESDAFEKSEYLTSIIIPAGTESIGNWAFENCQSLKDIFIPESVTDLGSNLFYKCSDVTVHGKNNSAAEKFANDNSLTFVNDYSFG